MTDFDDRLIAIAAAPPGRDTIAFFDLDGTLINGFSARAVFLERLKTLDVTVKEQADATRYLVGGDGWRDRRVLQAQPTAMVEVG